MNRAKNLLNSMWWIRYNKNVRKVFVKDIYIMEYTPNKYQAYISTMDYTLKKERDYKLYGIEWLKRCEGPE